MKLRLALLIGALFLPCVVHAAPREVCAAGAAALDHTLSALPPGEPLIVSASLSPNLQVTPDALFSGQREATLSDPIVAAWNGAAPSNLFQACPQLTRRLPQGWRYATPEEESAIQRPTIHYFSAPVVRDGDALVQTGFACVGLCGIRRVELYRRGNAGWRFIAYSAAAIS
jgi:hypothetical protein